MLKYEPSQNTKRDKLLVILICNKTYCKPIDMSLDLFFKIKTITSISEIQHIYRNNSIYAIVSYVLNGECEIFEKNIVVCQQFPSIPKLAVINDARNIELIRKCGEIGIDKVILASEIDTINQTLNDLFLKKGVIITLNDLGIVQNDFPELLRKALLIIEQNYLRLKFVEDISNQLGVSYRSLAGMVYKSSIVSLKKVLLLFKVKHSLYLLQSNNLSVSEVSLICGFSNEKRYREGLKRLVGLCPKECQSLLLLSTIDEFWNKYINKEKYISVS